MFLRTKSIIGLDVDASGINLLQICGSKNHFKIKTYATVAFNKAQSDYFARALEDLLTLAKPTTNAVVFGLPYTLCKHKIVPLDKLLPPKTLEKYCAYVASRELGLTSTEVNYAYKVLTKNLSIQDQHTQNIELEIIGVAKSTVTNYHQTLKKFGLKLKIIDLNAYALVRALKWHLKSFSAEAVIFHSDGETILCCGVKAQDIFLIREFSYPIDATSYDLFTVEFNKFFKSYPKKIFLSGKIASDPIFSVQLADKFTAEVVIFNPFLTAENGSLSQSQGIYGKDVLAKHPQKFAVSFGLALRLFEHE